MSSAAKVHLNHFFVGLHVAQQTFGEHAAFVQHRHLAFALRQQVDKLHVVFHHHQ